MKFSIAVVYFAIEAMARQSFSAVKRDLATINDVLDNVKSDLRNLSDAVKTAGNDPGPLLLASNALITTLKSGKTKTDPTSELSFLDAIGLIRPVQELTKLADSLIGNLKGIREKIKANGQCLVVQLQISNINNGSQALIQSVNSKVPASVRDIANQLTHDLSKVLEKSKDDYSQQNCVNFGPPTPEPTGNTSNSPRVRTAGPTIFAGVLTLTVAALVV